MSYRYLTILHLQLAWKEEWKQTWRTEKKQIWIDDKKLEWKEAWKQIWKPGKKLVYVPDKKLEWKEAWKQVLLNEKSDLNRLFNEIIVLRFGSQAKSRCGYQTRN